jgi:hypothetical protein
MKKMIFVVLILFACALGKDKPTAAQATIKSDPAKIKAVLLANLVNDGYVVDSDTEYQLQVSKPLGLFKESPPSAHEVLFGHSASPMNSGNHDCRVVHPIILVPNGDATNVTMRYEQMCGHVGGDTVREVRVSKKLIEAMRATLDAAKAKLEK